MPIERPKLHVTGHLINHARRIWNYSAVTENGRKLPGIFQNSGAVINYATYFGFEIIWHNAPWQNQTPAAA